MNRYLLSKAGINANEGIHRFGDSKEKYEHYLNEFMEDELFKNLEDAIEKKDVHQSFMAAHSLKGVSGNLSMTNLEASLKPFVEALRRDDLDEALTMFDDVKEKYLIVQDALKSSQN